MTRIKICGITRHEDALFCASLGADFLGFIFEPTSSRYIEPERAAAVASAVRAAERPPRLVGVFRDASPEYVRQVVSEVGLDLVQLHGEETDDAIREIAVPAIKVRRVAETLPSTSEHPSAQWFLFDTYDERRAGGTGRRFDWSLLANYDRSRPFFLSGGIDPDNVSAAISLVRPDAIDLASGVEAEPGVKDHSRVARLFERVRRA